MKKSLRLILLVLLAVSSGPSHLTVAHLRASSPVPRSATVTIRLLKAPGLNLRQSKWEISAELRIIAENRMFSEREKFKDDSTERAGEIIKSATLSRSLGTPSGQSLILEIPFSAAVLEKLRNQPADRLAAGADVNSQVFLFYSVITVHDAKLGKTLTIPVNRVWDFANFPAAVFDVNVEIGDDGGYSVKSSSVKSPGLTIQRKTR